MLFNSIIFDALNWFVVGMVKLKGRRDSLDVPASSSFGCESKEINLELLVDGIVNGEIYSRLDTVEPFIALLECFP